MYIELIELIFVRHPNGGYTYYTAEKVYPTGTSIPNKKWMTRKDAEQWASVEYPQVPVRFVQE